MSSSEWETLLNSYDQLKEAMLLLLQTKTNYMKCLQFLFFGLAAISETDARTCAKLCVDAFEADPRQEAHSAVTWKLMKPGSWFHEELTQFIQGTLRSSCSVAFQIQIATWRFGSACETTIEAKHQRVSMSSKGKSLGPVRVSLANRMPMLQRNLLSGHYDGAELLQCFHFARNLKNLVKTFGLEDHPTLSGRQLEYGDVARAIYHATLPDLFSEKGEQSKANVTHKRKAAEAEAKLVGKSTALVDYSSVWGNACQSHIETISNANTTFCMPADIMSVECLKAVLAKPMAKRRRLDDGSPERPGPEFESSGGDGIPCVFFNVVLANIGAKKFPRVAPGGGGKVKRGQIAISVHAQVSSSADEVPVIQRTRSSFDTASMYIWDGLMSDDRDHIREHALMWRGSGSNQSSLAWTFSDLHVGSHSHKQVSSVIAAMIFTQDKGLAATEHQQPILDACAERGSHPEFASL